ncbi:MAG TPA: DUF4082 domain-containing protein [Tepidisphaeraceae bacterium]
MRSKFVVIPVAASWVFAAGLVRGDPALECTGVVNYTGDHIITLGWSFTTNQPITIDALDVYSDNMINVAGEVRLYNSVGTTLASAIVTTSDPSEGSPFTFYSHPITPVNLAADQTYFVAEDISNFGSGAL